jgi:hypothetical protein
VNVLKVQSRDDVRVKVAIREEKGMKMERRSGQRVGGAEKRTV